MYHLYSYIFIYYGNMYHLYVHLWWEYESWSWRIWIVEYHGVISRKPKNLVFALVDDFIGLYCPTYCPRISKLRKYYNLVICNMAMGNHHEKKNRWFIELNQPLSIATLNHLLVNPRGKHWKTNYWLLGIRNFNLPFPALFGVSCRCKFKYRYHPKPTFQPCPMNHQK